MKIIGRKLKLEKKYLLALAWFLTLVASPSLLALQYAHPDGVISNTGPFTFNTVGLWQDVGEGHIPNDATAIQATAPASSIEFSLTNTIVDPGVDTGHILKFRASGGGKKAYNITISLYEGASLVDESAIQVGKNDPWTEFSYAIPAAAISVYNDLNIRITAPDINAQTPANISWIELETPNAAVLTPPTVDTPTFADVTDTTATLGGTVSSDGGATITERGTVWGLAADPDIVAQAANVNTVAGTTGIFSGPVSGLPSGTLIHFRAYASNSEGTSYSADTTFTTTTPAVPPTVDTPTFADVTDTTATLGGNVSGDGGGAITERGTVWGLAADPDIVAQAANVNTVAGTTGIFSGPVSGLPSGTLIHFRAYASNSAGTSYSADTTFTTTTPAVPPTVDTPTFADVTATTATLGGNVSSDGGGAITERGTVWGLAADPDIVAQAANVNTVAGTTGIFSGPVSGLPAGTLIHFRAYATNSAGTSYSADTTFTTLVTLPTVDTPTFADVTDTTATLGGNVSSDGGGAITERGTVWGLAADPDIVAQAANVNTVAGTTGIFSGPVSGLPSGTLIHFRAYASNSEGTSYSADTTFTTTTPAVPPTVDTPTFADVTDTTATLGGNVSGDGGGAITERGTVWGLAADPDIVAQAANVNTVAGTTGIFSGPVSGLPSGTLIHFRAYASNSAGTSYSADTTFTTTTPAVPPTVDTPTFADVTATTATLGGNVSSDGGGAITERGTVWGLAADPDIVAQAANVNTVAGTTGIFSGPVSGLPAGTLIHFRAYASNSAGTSYSADTTFTTLVTLPTVDSPSFVAVTDTSANLGGTVSDDGGAAVTDRGTVWGLAPLPTGNIQSEGSGTGIFSHLVSGLPTATLVYYRAYATNTAGTAYSADGSFTLTATTTPPELNAPTAASINYFSALLGGTITSDGGEAITARGTVWNLTGPPIVENLLNEGGTATGAFSHTRINLPKDTTIWYRAYATNAQGTGYSADASFVTAARPDVQVSNITFPQVGANSIRINWTRGNGEGNIVVLRLATTGRTDPADGSDYTGNPDFALAAELPTNSQNFVIYNGTHNAIQVHGLSQLTNYTVAIYTYAGSGASIAYLTPPAEASQATTDVAVHNMDYAPDCSHCHNHGSFLAHDAEQEAVCVTCHIDTGPASAKLDFGLHLTPGYAADDVDCGSCHELHNPNGSTTSTHTLAPFATTTNKAFIRSDVDKYVSTAAAGNVAIYHTPIDDLAIEDGDASTARGICQSCHTQVGNHRHDGTGDQCHDGGGGNCDPISNGGTDCLGCHTHVDNFAASGGGCTGCHSSTQGGAPPLDRREIVSEFSRLTHHVGGPLADSDCEVCHQQAATDHNHQDGSLTLWNVDTHGTAGDYQLSDHSDPNTDVAEAAVLTPFCLNCHDSDGAQAEASPSAPFTGSGAPPDIETTWTVSSHAIVSQTANGSSQPTTCLGDGAFGCHGTGHGSEKLNLLTPAGTAATPPDFSEQREGFCLNCHTTNGASSIDIHAQLGGLATDFQETGNNGSGAPINQKHDILPADQTYSGGAVTCSDCHEPHTATTANPNIDPDTDLMFTNLYNKGSSYISGLPEPDGNGDGTYLGPTWTYDSGSNLDPTDPIGGSAYSEPDSIEFCLTCHDGVTPPGVTMSTGMINIATSYQVDYHGRGDAGSAGNGDFKVPWVATLGDEPGTPYAALNCTLCHTSHGSGNIYHLRESITIGNSPAQEVGGWSGDTIGSLSGTTYTLPLTGGVQVDHDWGGWCSFCHDMQAHKVDEDKACRSGHMHGGGAF